MNLTFYKCETEAELHFSWLKISPVEPRRPSQCQEPLRDPRETQLWKLSQHLFGSRGGRLWIIGTFTTTKKNFVPFNIIKLLHLRSWVESQGSKLCSEFLFEASQSSLSCPLTKLLALPWSTGTVWMLINDEKNRKSILKCSEIFSHINRHSG